MDVSVDVLREQVADQVGTLSAIATAEGGRVAYLKPHGALYHRVARDADQARAVLEGSGGLPVLGMPGSLLLELAAAAGREVRHEGFPDRAYTSDGGLVPRSEPGAVVTDGHEIARRAVVLATRVSSVCLHGDTPGAVRHAALVRGALEVARIEVRSCWSSPG
jgi:UPF0271 protein